MAIDLATGFNIGSKDAIDERQVLTLEQMKNLDESIYPDKYFAICKDDGKLYLYDVSNDVSEISGKFRVLEGNVTGDSTVVDGARYYTLDEVDLSYYFLLAKINFGDKTSFSGKMTFMFNHPSSFKSDSIPFTEKKELFFNHKEGKKFNYVMHAYPVINPAISNSVQPTLFKEFNFRGILTENNEFYLFLFGMLNNENYIHNFYIEYIGDGSIEKTFEFDDVSPNPRTVYNWSASKWFTEERMSDKALIMPSYIELPDRNEVVSKGLESKVYSSLSELGCNSSVALTTPMYKLYPSQALFCDVTEFSDYQTLFPYEEEADAESRVYILCIERESNYYLRWERKDGTKQAICYNNDRLGQPIVWNMIVGGGTIDLSGYAKTYTSLTELGLTADATVEDVVNTLKNGESFLAPVNTFTNYETIFPNKVPSDQWNKIHIIKGASLPNSHIRCFSQNGACEYLANVNNTNITGWNDVSGTYTDISDSVIEKLGTEILKYPVGKYRINSNATGNKFTDLPSDAESKSGLIEVNGTAVGKSPFTDTWVYRMYKFECLSGTTSYIRRLDSGATAGQIEHDTGWRKEGKETYTSLIELGLTAEATIDDVIGALKDGETAMITTNEFTNYLTMFPNYCDKDQYAILKVERKNGNRCFIEWRQKDGNAYAIGGLKPSNEFSDWNNLVRFKKDGYADDSIVCIGDTLSSDGVIQTLEKLGFSNDILTWDTGVYRVSHVSGLINLPSDITSAAPGFRLEHHDCKKWGANHNPNTQTWAMRHSVLYAEGGNVYHRYTESGNTAGVYTKDTGWQQIHTKKEEDSYIPDMYDRNANGDIPVVGFDRLASSMCLIQNTNLLNNGDVYDEDYVGGWVYTMANDILIKDKEMFNKIKVIVSIPGVLRIGIVNDKIFEANPRYSTCLVKWLVADFVAFTGLKEYDISDTILEEGQYVFIECRQGESSWYYNQGSTAVTQGKVTYPANSCTSGLNVADKLDSTTNNVVFKSQSVTSKSAIFTFSSEMNVGNKLRTNFLARGYDNTARTDMSDVKSYNQSLFKGGLNVGLYRRTKYSDTRFCKCVENCDAVSIVGNGTSYTKLFASLGQEALEGKSVYAFKLDVNTIGNITIYHMKGTTKDTVEIIDKYTHYVRAKGLQTIHLPFDIKLGKGEYIGFGGIHCKSTSDNVVQCECKWHYKYNTRVSWMNTYDTRQTGFYNMTVDLATYPERFTEFGANSSYLNIELICRGEKRSPLEDKYISFTGDSITTFAGFCTKQADVPAGNSAGDNAVYYPASGRTVNNVDATWWGILAKDNRMQILRNDAWSGSRVSSTTGSTDTKCLCGTERYKFLENGSQGTNVTFPYGEPEIVVNMIGTNDLSGNVELGEGILYGLSSPTEDDYKKLYNAYSLMCQRIASYYNRHGGKVVHFILPRGTGLNTYANSNGDSIQKIALEFEKIAKSWGHYFIPLSYFTGFNMNQYKNLTCPTSNVLRDFRSSYFNGSDGLHPNVIGMETIADGVHRFLCSIM